MLSGIVIFFYSIITHADFQSTKNIFIGKNHPCGSTSNEQQDGIIVTDNPHIIYEQKQAIELAMANQMMGTNSYNHSSKKIMHKKENSDHTQDSKIFQGETIVEVAPVIRLISNFSERVKNNEQFYVYDAFVTFEGGYQMIMSICMSGCHAGEGTHISVYVHLMKGPNDDQLEKLNYWPFSGVLEIALLDQYRDECHCYKYIALDENVSSECTDRVTIDDKIGFGCGLDFGWLLSGLNNTVFLRNDSLHFRISYSRYFFYGVLQNTLLETKTFVSISLYNWIIVSAVLIFAEFIVFCFSETVLKPRLLDFGSVIVFLFTNLKVTFYTGFNVLSRTIYRFLMLVVVVASNILAFAAVEVMYSDMSTVLETFEVFKYFIQRVCHVLMWSWTIEVYKMSWESNLFMIGPMWILHLLSLDLYKVLLFVYRIYNVFYVPSVCILIFYDLLMYLLYKNKVGRFILKTKFDALFLILCIVMFINKSFRLF